MTTVEVAYPARPLPEYHKMLIHMVATAIPELATIGGLIRVSDQAPADLGTLLAQGGAYATVQALGGPSYHDRIEPTVDLDVYAGTHALANDISHRLDEQFMGAPFVVRHPTLGLLHVSRTQGSISPSERPWDPSRAIRRYHSSYRLVIERN